MPIRRAFTLVELLVVIVAAVVLLLILLPLFTARTPSHHRTATSNVRGVHQGMVIYAQSNNYYLPGLGTNGLTLPAGVLTTGDAGADGSTVGARYWILLNGGFISPDLLINENEALTQWSTNGVTTGNYSYAMLRITTTNGDAGRRAEWKDNANGAAALISDRNVGTDASDANVRSLWTTLPGHWEGSVVWGDNHVSFELTNRLSNTVYAAVKQSNDNLFATLGGPGVSDDSTDSTANAFMTWTN